MLEMFSSLAAWAIGLVGSFGWPGIFFGMVLESSIVPIPSELILVTAGMTQIPLWEIAVAAAFGSTIGSVIGYYIGRFCRPLVDKYGKYIFITEKRINGAESWFNRRGSIAILVSRLIPFVPFKVFSITAGVLKMDLKKFITFTFIGTIPRALALAAIGSAIINMQFEILGAALLACAIAYVAWLVMRRRKNSNVAAATPA